MNASQATAMMINVLRSDIVEATIEPAGPAFNDCLACNRRAAQVADSKIALDSTIVLQAKSSQ